MAATRSLPLPLVAILLFEIADGVGEAPLIDVDRIVARREDATAADLAARSLHIRLVVQPLEQLVQEPPRYAVAFARIYEAEIEQRHQEHLPVELHVAE